MTTLVLALTICHPEAERVCERSRRLENLFRFTLTVAAMANIVEAGGDARSHYRRTSGFSAFLRSGGGRLARSFEHHQQRNGTPLMTDSRRPLFRCHPERALRDEGSRRLPKGPVPASARSAFLIGLALLVSHFRRVAPLVVSYLPIGRLPQTAMPAPAKAQNFGSSSKAMPASKRSADKAPAAMTASRICSPVN
jgi:hypothetical protein